LATSTTAARLPPVGAGAGKVDGAVVAVVITAATVVASRCGSVVEAAARGGSLIIAVAPPVSLGGLDERCLVGTGAPVLSALAGARGEQSASPCEREEQK
jgi:hypothetical protein